MLALLYMQLMRSPKAQVEKRPTNKIIFFYQMKKKRKKKREKCYVHNIFHNIFTINSK